MKIAILTPSRSRAKLLDRFLSTIRETSSNNIIVDLYVFVDLDDPDLQMYKDYEKTSDAIFLYDNVNSIGVSWNIMANIAIRDGAEILIMGNDDQMFETPNWDEIVVQRVAKYEDNIYCAWFNDNINGEKHCAFPIVSSKWVEIVGSFTSEEFKFGYHDTWTYDIGKRVNRCEYISEVMVKHFHHSVPGGVNDVVSKKVKGKEPRSVAWAFDKTVYESTSNKRQQHAEELLDYINNKKI